MLLLILTRFVRRYKEFFRRNINQVDIRNPLRYLLESVKKISIAQGLILCYHLNIIAKKYLHLT